MSFQCKTHGEVTIRQNACAACLVDGLIAGRDAALARAEALENSVQDWAVVANDELDRGEALRESVEDALHYVRQCRECSAGTAQVDLINALAVFDEAGKGGA